MTKTVSPTGPQTGGPREFQIPLIPSPTFPDLRGFWGSGVTLRLDRPGRLLRYRLLYVDRTGSTRRAVGGPLVPGPCADAVELGVAIDNDGGSGAESARGLADGTEILVRAGDVLLLGGVRFRIRVVRNVYLELDLLPED